MREVFLKQNKTSLYINIKFCVVYESGRWTNNPVSVYALEDCLYGVVKLTKNTDNDEHGYSGYVFDFIHIQVFSLSFDGIGKNVVVICADNSLSANVDVLGFGNGSTDELDDHIRKII